MSQPFCPLAVHSGCLNQFSLRTHGLLLYIYILYKETPVQVNSQPVNLSEDDLQVKPTDVELALQSCLVIGRDRSFF